MPRPGTARDGQRGRPRMSEWLRPRRCRAATGRRNRTRPILPFPAPGPPPQRLPARPGEMCDPPARSEEHTSELQSLMRISYAVFRLKKKQEKVKEKTTRQITVEEERGKTIS